MTLKQAPWLVGIAAAVLIGRGAGQPASAPNAARPAAATGGGVTAPKETRSPGAAAPQANARQSSRRRYARLYREFLGMEAPPPPPSRGALAARVRGTLAAQPLRIDLSPQDEELPIGDQDLRRIAQAARGHGYERLKFMIVLLADPIDSGLASDFDLAMIAVQRAMADSGYLHDRQWLPWIDPEAAEEKAFRETAGMMLFRRPPDRRQPAAARSELLAVFLVGETPKLGIHKQAFLKAVDFILDLHQADSSVRREASPASSQPPGTPAETVPPQLPSEIPVLGPTFSGSAESLRIALREATSHLDVSFRIVSGSASSPTLKAQLQEGDLSSKVTFARTVIADDLLAEKGLRFLQDRLGWNLHRAALLVEFDTAIASYFASDEGLLAKIIKLPFPSGIFELRNAWAQVNGGTPQPGTEAAGSRQASAPPRTALDVSLADQRTPVDMVPELTPVSSRVAEMAAANLLREVSRGGFRYIGILATDIKDQLFLAEQVRRWAPNVILFVIDNNMLYTHPQYSAAMFGTITISSFPLIPEPAPSSLPEAGPERNLVRQFFSERQEGIYFAARSFTDHVWPPRAVWIAATGNAGIWPLARVELGSTEAGAIASAECLQAGPQGPSLGPARSNECIEPAHPPSPTLPYGSFLLLPLLATALCLVSWQVRARILRFSRAVDDMNHRHTGPLILAAAGLPALAGAGILSLWYAWMDSSHAGILSLWYAWMNSSHAGWRQPEASKIGWSAWLVLLLLLAAFCLLLYLVFDAAAYRRQRPRQWWRWVLVTLFGSLCLVLTRFLLLFWSRGPDLRYLLLRSVALGGGMSPLVPLGWITAALFFWVIVELKRRLIQARGETGWPLEHYVAAPLKSACQDAELLGRFFEAAAPLKAFRKGAELLGKLCDAVADHNLAVLVKDGIWRRVTQHCALLWALLVAFIPVWLLWGNVQPIGESRLYGRCFLLVAAATSVPGCCKNSTPRCWFMQRPSAYRRNAAARLGQPE
jgi:hypothetical protein